MKKTFKIIIVLVGAITLTTLGIDAADTLNGSRSTLLGQLAGGDALSACPAGMIEIAAKPTLGSNHDIDRH